MNPPPKLKGLVDDIVGSYAHNSRLYAFMAADATHLQIAEFMTWDAAQPPFSEYLGRWLPRLSPTLAPALEHHIEEEAEGDHAGLFRRMHRELLGELGEPTFELEHARLDRLNYLFSAACAAERSVGFFLGGFLATELMSAKRCAQIGAGLRRVGSKVDLTYFDLHAEADAHHWLEVGTHLIEPGLAAGDIVFEDVQAGVTQRLESSGAYLKWYETRVL